MLETTKSETSRKGSRSPRAETGERAKRVVQEKTEGAKEEVGRIAFDVLEDRFPEEAKSRQRQNSLMPMLIGVAIGFLLGTLLGRSADDASVRERLPPRR